METKRRFTEYGPEKKTQRGDSNLKKNSTIKNLVSVTGVLMVISVCAWRDPCANYDLELESQSIKIWFGNDFCPSLRELACHGEDNVSVWHNEAIISSN
jgi:hypothetical protein